MGWADIYPLKADQRDEPEELREDNTSGSRGVRLPWRGPGSRGCPAPDRHTV